MYSGYNIHNTDVGSEDCTSAATAASPSLMSSDGRTSKNKVVIFCDQPSDGFDDSKSGKNFADWNKRQNHSEIEKRRRDKMNTYISELSQILPECKSRKLDKLSVLRMAAVHIKMLRGSVNSYNQDQYKPSFITNQETTSLINSSSGQHFVIVIGCEAGKILHLSDSVQDILQYPSHEILGSSFYDILHPQDLNTVKEQMTFSDSTFKEKLVDAKTLLPVEQTKSNSTVTHVSHGFNRLSPGARRAFFCRIKLPQNTEEINSGKERRYVGVHFIGYLKSFLGKRKVIDESSDINRSWLVAVGKKKSEQADQNETEFFIAKLTPEAKFVNVDQQMTIMLGWLSQELVGQSLFDFLLNSEDSKTITSTIQALVRETANKVVLTFFMKHESESPVLIRSECKPFINPWTQELEYIITKNFRVNSDSPQIITSTLENGKPMENIDVRCEDGKKQDQDSLNRELPRINTSESESSNIAETTSESDEAAMSVIMSLLEADAGLGGPVDFSHLPWPLS